MINNSYKSKALCFIPLDDLELVFDLLTDPEVLDQSLWPFATYFFTYYIGTPLHPARFPPERWNMFQQ